MVRHSIDTVDRAILFYRTITDQPAKSILDFLIDHPDKRFDGAAIVRNLGLAEHHDVARSTYLMGQIAAELGYQRPWTEGQLGYLMPSHTAHLLRDAREQQTASLSG